MLSPFRRYRKSPEATPERNTTTAEKVVPEVVLNPLPASEKEDKPPSEDETARGDSDVKDGLSEGEGERQQQEEGVQEEEEEEEEEEATSAVASDSMSSSVQGAKFPGTFTGSRVWITTYRVRSRPSRVFFPVLLTRHDPSNLVVPCQLSRHGRQPVNCHVTTRQISIPRANCHDTTIRYFIP